MNKVSILWSKSYSFLVDVQININLENYNYRMSRIDNYSNQSACHLFHNFAISNVYIVCELPETLTADSCLLKSFPFKKMNKKVNSHEIVFPMNSRVLSKRRSQFKILFINEDNRYFPHAIIQSCRLHVASQK